MPVYVMHAMGSDALLPHLGHVGRYACTSCAVWTNRFMDTLPCTLSRFCLVEFSRHYV